jgi:hypothetical protein
MENINLNQYLIDLKCQILDILHSHKLQGQTEVPVRTLLEELGMDEMTNATGLDPDDTIELTSTALINVEAAKAKIRSTNFNLQ